MTPRPGVTADWIVDVAAELADRNGYEQLTLARVAAGLGVRTPSLYNHIDGLEELRVLLTVRALEGLHDELRRSMSGASGASGASDAPGAADAAGAPATPQEALRGFARGYRSFALAHPGLYATLVPSTERADPRIQRAGAPVLQLVLDTLAGSGLEGEASIHAARALRSALHGFVSLELAGGFALPASVEASFDGLTDLLARGLSRPAGTP